MQERQKGLLLTATGVLLLSPDALVLRWVAAEPLHVLAWRSLVMAIGLAILLGLRYRRRLPKAMLRCGRVGIGCALCYAASTMSYVSAISLAGAANTLLIYSVSPLIAGLLAWAALGECLSRRDIAAIAGCVIGIAVIVADDTPGSSLTGNLLALAAASLFAANLTLARSRPLVDMSPALIPGALLASAASFALGGMPQLAAGESVALAAMALLVLPLGFMLVQAGPRRIGAAEVGLLLLLEVVLGPIWVWAFLDEAPGGRVLLGGAVVLLALLAHSVAGWRGPRPVVAASRAMPSPRRS